MPATLKSPAPVPSQRTPFELLSSLTENEFAELEQVRHERLLANAEAIIVAAIESGAMPENVQSHLVRHHFSEDALAVLDRLGMDHTHEGRGKLVREIGRLRLIHEWRPIAGTPADRQAAQERLTAARAQRDCEVPALEAQIAELQGQVQALHASVAGAEQLVERQARAVSLLRERVPDRVREQFVMAENRLSREFAERLAELSGEVSRRRTALGTDVSSLQGRQGAHQQRTGEPLPFGTDFDHAAWKAYIQQAAEELPPLEAELAELQAQRAARLAELEREYLDLYVR